MSMITRYSVRLLKRHESYQRILYSVFGRYKSQWSNVENGETNVSKETKNSCELPDRTKVDNIRDYDSRLSKYSSDENDLSSNRWKLELDWLTKALEPALQLCRWALPTGNGIGNKPPPTSRSPMEIVASIQRSKLGLHDWSLSDLTIGLYLVYLRQASTYPFDDIKAEVISSDSIVEDLIYHVELAKGAYKDSADGLARQSMIQESNVVKFVTSSSMLRPGYYIGIDNRKKNVVLGIRGTHNVYDLITDAVSSTDEEITFEGYSTHFGTAEAARWFLSHELGSIKECLNQHKGFRLRLVGHSLGGATAALLAIMMRKKSFRELGFSPDIVSAVGYGTPPCVSRELAENCSDFVTTVVMQDDIIPRLSAASLTRLRNEILQTDWTSIFDKEDWKSIVDLVTNAKHVMSSVQEVAQKLAARAKFSRQTKNSDAIEREESTVIAARPSHLRKNDELFVPGTVYFLKRNVESSSNGKGGEFFTLLKRNPGEHFQRILLSNNLISDHKCDSHYYALRDVLKGLPESNF